MLSPIQNFPLKFLYFDIIKKSKEVFILSCGFVTRNKHCSDPICDNGAVHVLDTGGKCWAESGGHKVMTAVSLIRSGSFHFFSLVLFLGHTEVKVP